MTQIFPNTIIAGFPKCGTSSLWHWLNAHPEVCGSKYKETLYFFDKVRESNKNANFHDHGWDGYAQLFENCKNAKVVFEATPEYATRNTALRYLPEIRPLPKFIFLLREPAERLFSFYRFQKYRMRNEKVVNQSFSEFLEERTKPHGRGQVGMSCYVRFLKNWRDQVGDENLGVFLMEEMMEDPKGFMKKLSTFLKIDPSFYEDFDFPKGNPTVKVKSKSLHKLGSKIQSYFPPFLQNKVLIPLYLKINADKAPKSSSEDLAIKEKLKKDYKECNTELAQIFNLDLTYWS